MRKVLVASFLLGLAACTTTGPQALQNETQESVAAKVTIGATTKNQVRAAFGNPTDTRLNMNGSEEWVYRVTRSTPTADSFVPVVSALSRGATIEENRLNFLFEGDKLINYTVNRATREVRQGLMH